jgi:hypothetical protein
MQVNEIPAGVHFYNHRGRLIHLLPPGTQEREDAENVARLREQGVTFREINQHTDISVSTLHRMMTRLALTLEIESGVRDREIRRVAREARGAGKGLREATPVRALAKAS